MRIDPPPTSLNSCRPLFSCNFGKQKEGKYPTTLCVTKVVVVASGQVGRQRQPVYPLPPLVVLAGLRAAPLAKRLSSSKASLGLACQA